MAKKKQEEYGRFKRLLDHKQFPILTLDPKWHELFPDYAKNARIRSLEKRLNELLKRQGRLVNEAKDMKKLKHRLMQGIIMNMEEKKGEEGRIRDKKQEKSQELILDINERMKAGDSELMGIPYQIREANEELLIECMNICYEKIRSNSRDIREIGIWVSKVREELKNKILEKQDKEMQNEAMYSYMHHILGAEVINVFDEMKKPDTGQEDN